MDIGSKKFDCYQSVKDRKFESNSQLRQDALSRPFYCYQSVKDRKFESNSQLTQNCSFFATTVISLSKIENLKAIHNYSLTIKI